MGDAEGAFSAGMALVSAYRELWVEAARLRFRINFGSSLCENCEGLKAGPGVVATCFQVRQCSYSNVREDAVSARHLQVINRLSK